MNRDDLIDALQPNCPQDGIHYMELIRDRGPHAEYKCLICKKKYKYFYETNVTEEDCDEPNCP